ncbi:hypothetical protein BOX15_Mlig033109g1, partial [Macrostomum lignano]|uniref:SID1 transmembrane family member 1 n=2 Tax=Macrostomum lignano TaxID=282301 RepID=A0A1I8HEF1_9PLAT
RRLLLSSRLSRDKADYGTVGGPFSLLSMALPARSSQRQLPYEHLSLLIFSLLILSLPPLAVGDGGEQQPQRHIVAGEFNLTYNYSVSSTNELVFRFNYTEIVDVTQAVRLTIVSESASSDHPVLVVARQQREIVSWRLPLFYSSEEKEFPYYIVSRTLCPTLPLGGSVTGRVHTIFVEVTTQNPNMTAFSLNASIVPNFQLYLGASHGIRSAHVSPSQPKYYKFEFPPNVSSVQVRMVSDDMLCMRVSVQAVNCPVYDLARNVEFTGIRQTASKKASLSVTTSDPALASATAFYVVLVVYPTDANCRPNIPAQLVPPDPGEHGRELYRRTKQLNITVLPSLGINEYFLPVFGTIFFFLLFYAAAFIIALLHHTYETRRLLARSRAGAANNYDGNNAPIEDTPESPLRQRGDAADVGDNSTDFNEASNSSPRNYLAVGETPTVRTATMSTTATFSTAAMSSLSMQRGTLPSQMSVVEPPASANSATTSASTNASDALASTSAASASATVGVGTGVGEDGGFVDLMAEANQEKEIFRLRKDMTVQDLSRKPPSRLRKKYKLYYWYLIIISIFYCLPVIQLVLTYQKVLNTSGDEDMCYYNFDCAHTLGVISSFNNVFSNISYVLLGLLFLLLCWRRDLLHQNLVRRDPRASQYGIPHHYGLYYAVGIALIMEGVLSGCYHICPSYNNFQFDTAFMYMLSGLCMLKIYQTRHPDVNASAHMAYMALAIIIFTGLLGVFYSKESTTFYTLFCILVIVTSILLTLEVYYVGRWKMNVGRLKRLYLLVRTDGLSCFRPQRRDRLVLLIFANSINWSIGLYGAFKRPEDFSTFMLSILMVNMMMYFVFYIIMKLRNGERLAFTPVAFTLLDIAAWAGAGYFFLQSPTNWEDSASGSRIRNQACVLAGFYDVHDIWHFLSAVAMFLGFNIILTMDDDLAYVRRDRIRVF